jgi:putative transposase
VKEVDGIKPNVLINDGAPNFHTTYNRELYTNKWPRTRHIDHIRLQGDYNNNKMERMNGEIRDREKTMRTKENGYSYSERLQDIS